MASEHRLAARRAAFEALEGMLIESGAKGIPPQIGTVTLGDIGRRGWNVLAGDVTMPAAVLRQSALRRNSAAMRVFLAGHAMAIAPHGKTTMAPQLYALQHDDGAWGITISTVQHLAICRRFAFDRMIIANELESGQALRASSQVGSFDTLHSTALGKAIMSRMAVEERDTLLAEAKLVARTVHTATDPAALRSAIEGAARGGLAIDDQENEIGMRCVAAPILNADGWPLAAISVSGPSSRMTHAALDRIGEQVGAACALVSGALARPGGR